MKDFSQKAKYMLCQISGKISINTGGTYGTVKITCIFLNQEHLVSKN